MRWHNGWGQVNEELLPNGVLLSYEVFRGSLRLDGQSIANLELLENKDDGGRAGQILFNTSYQEFFVAHAPLLKVILLACKF